MLVSRIRPATERDLLRLVEVEVAAGQLFHAVGMSIVAEDMPDVADLRDAVEAQRVWVTVVGEEIAGYIAAERVDGKAHVAQVSVAPAHAGRRIGRDMIELVEEWGRTAGFPATTLTTFRDVPWNAPYYRRLGYEFLADDQVGPELARIMSHEAALPGIDPSLRCAMIKPNP
jgi:ribosomal protein S18 acetylase RimI-like enzyme